MGPRSSIDTSFPPPPRWILDPPSTRPSHLRHAALHFFLHARQLLRDASSALRVPRVDTLRELPALLHHVFQFFPLDVCLLLQFFRDLHCLRVHGRQAGLFQTLLRFPEDPQFALEVGEHCLHGGKFPLPALLLLLHAPIAIFELLGLFEHDQFGFREAPVEGVVHLLLIRECLVAKVVLVLETLVRLLPEDLGLVVHQGLQRRDVLLPFRGLGEKKMCGRLRQRGRDGPRSWGDASA